jgi:flagellar motor switch protein FliG
MSATPQVKGTPPPSQTLTGAEKVALLLLALGKTRAAKLLRRFDPEDLRVLSQSAASLRPIPLANLDALIEEFSQRFSTGLSYVGSVDDVKSLLADAVAAEEREPAPEETSSETPVWDILAGQKPEVLQSYLLKEHPQTIAVILSKIGSEPAATIVGIMPAELRNSLLARMLNIKTIDHDAFEVVESTLREDFSTTVGGGGAYSDIANILNRLDKSQSEEVIRRLAETRPEDAKALRRLLFTFEELPLLSQKARGVLFDQVPIERLVLALRGTDQAFQATILSSLASRSRRMVEAELQNATDVPPRDIAAARRAIVDTVLKMSAKGEIELPKVEGEEGQSE